MIFTATQISGVWLLGVEPSRDERGFFARTWCQRELAERGLDATIAQESLSYSRRKGTLRGLHFQRAPYEEVKVVRCIRGAIFDVVVDLRPHSPTYLTWQAFELTAGNRKALYIPKGCAHGLQTLKEDTEALYQISEFHAPQSADGYRYDDPAFGIAWPLPVSAVSERDLGWPRFEVDAVRVPMP